METREICPVATPASRPTSILSRNSTGMLQKLIGRSPSKPKAEELKFDKMNISGPPRLPKQRNSPELLSDLLKRTKSGSSEGSEDSITTRISSYEPSHTLDEKYGKVNPVVVGFGATAKVK